MLFLSVMAQVSSSTKPHEHNFVSFRPKPRLVLSSSLTCSTTLDSQLHWGWWILVPAMGKGDRTAFPKTGWVPGISIDILLAPDSPGHCAWQRCTHGIPRETGLSQSPHSPTSGWASQTHFSGNSQTQLSPLFICQWKDGFLFLKKCSSWNYHC